MKLYVVIEENPDEGRYPCFVTENEDLAMEAMRNSFLENKRLYGSCVFKEDVVWHKEGSPVRGWSCKSSPFSCEVEQFEEDFTPSVGDYAYVVMTGDTIREFDRVCRLNDGAIARQYELLCEYIASCDGNATEIQFDGTREEGGWYSPGDGTRGCHVYKVVVR